MADTVVTPIETALAVRYETTEEQIAQLGASLKGVTFDTPENYKNGVKSIAQVRGLRTAVEKRRKELKADSVAYGKRVDAAAHKLTDLIEAIETPLLAAKKAVDDEEERLKKEQERADLIALDARLTAEREAAEAAAKVERDAEGARLAAERERLAAEKIQQEEANRVAAEAQRVEREKLDAQRAELRKQQEAIEAANKEAQRLESERQQREQAERDRLAAEEAARVEAVRLDAIRPDVEKVHAYASEIRSLADRAPAVESAECRKALDWAIGRLTAAAGGLEAFKGKTS